MSNTRRLEKAILEKHRREDDAELYFCFIKTILIAYYYNCLMPLFLDNSNLDRLRPSVFWCPVTSKS
jgi:hypothetical protein